MENIKKTFRLQTNILSYKTTSLLLHKTTKRITFIHFKFYSFKIVSSNASHKAFY